MSSPNCAGCIALLLSGLKELKLKWNPYYILHSIQSSAKLLENIDKFSQGIFF
jgi:hypothetical protein